GLIRARWRGISGHYTVLSHLFHFSQKPQPVAGGPFRAALVPAAGVRQAAPEVARLSRSRARLRQIRMDGARLERRRRRFLPDVGSDGASRLEDRPAGRGAAQGARRTRDPWPQKRLRLPVHFALRARRVLGIAPARNVGDKMGASAAVQRVFSEADGCTSCEARVFGQGERMKQWAMLALSAMAAACATAPVAPPPGDLFNDQLFAAPSERISASDVFAVSDEMRRYLSVDVADELRSKGQRQGLVDALYSKAKLQLEYDSGITRNAAQ